jgi:lysozyme
VTVAVGLVPPAAAATTNSPPSRTYGLPPGAPAMPALTTAQTAGAAPAGSPGIDVSNWQGTIQWSAVAGAGYRFAVAKASEGTTYLDPYYPANRAHAELRGLRVGAYDFARPSGRTTRGAGIAGRREARFFLAAAQPRLGELRPTLDVEKTGGLSPHLLTAWVAGWVGTVRTRLGYKPTIYTSPSFWQTALGDDDRFAHEGVRLWQAQWTTASQPSVPANDWSNQGWTVWQWTDCGRVPGVAGCVDMDVARPSTGFQDMVMGVPHDVVAPRPAGKAIVGHELTARLGAWRAPASVGFHVYWGRCHADGAACTGLPHRGLTYRVARADAGSRLRVVVDAHDRYGDTWIASTPGPVVVG